MATAAALDRGAEMAEAVDGRKWVVLLVILLACCWPGEAARAQGQEVTLLAPLPNQETMAKRPLLRATISRPFKPDSLLIMLDGVDITGLAEFTPTGFTVRPVTVLPAGDHSLQVTGTFADQQPFAGDFSFATRHYPAFKEAYSNNNLSLIASQATGKGGSLAGYPNSRLEANLGSETIVKQDGFSGSFHTNIRHLGQDEPVAEPEKRGLNLVNFLLAASYNRGRLQSGGELGDTQLELSENTITGLARRGGQLHLGYDDRIRLGGFAVNSSEVFGLHGDLGVNDDDRDHIMGLVGDFTLSRDLLSLRTFYSRGGEVTPGFGGYSDQGARQGEVYGVLLRSTLLAGRLNSEFELDWADFDPDLADTLPSVTDAARRFRLQGNSGRYSYGLTYKYIGPDYEVIGNPCLTRDREGVELTGGAALEKHAINLTYGHHNDNLEHDPFRARIVGNSGRLDYSFSGLAQLPLFFTFQKEYLDSQDEPPLTEATDKEIDQLTASLSYMKEKWTWALQTTYSYENDRTVADLDIANTMISLMPQYAGASHTACLNLTYSRAEDYGGGLATENYLATLDLQGRLLNERLNYGTGLTYERSQTSDNALSQRSVKGQYSLMYLLAATFRGFEAPAVGLRGEFSEVRDQVARETTWSHLVLLLFSVNYALSI